MADKVDRQKRSKMMSAVRGKNTKLETDIRHHLFSQGFRYRLHVHDLPGKPDIVLPKHSAVIFVHGCFWHFHSCARSTVPQNRREWWKKKLMDNKIRDERNLAELLNDGWRILVVWECSVRRSGINREVALELVCSRAGKFLRSKRKYFEISGPMLKTMSERKEHL